MEYEPRKCIICGKNYIPRAPRQKICMAPDCRLEFRRMHERRRSQFDIEKEKAQRAMSKLKPNTLTKDAIAAKAAGMSYGQYMASK